MASNTDIIGLISSEGELAVDQVIEDSKRLAIVINGDGNAEAITEDGSRIPSVRKALIENLYFKSPIPWRNGTSVTVFNQLYSFTGEDGITSWWYAPGATVSNPIRMGDSPLNNTRFRIFLDRSNMDDIYARILSPNFRGNPRAPSPAKNDSSSSIATTEWVQGEISEVNDSIDDLRNGNFENITVSNNSNLNNVSVKGNFSITSDTVSAPDTTGIFNKTRLVGEDAGISFDDSSEPPAGITSKTSIKPFMLTTGDLYADRISSESAIIGSIPGKDPSLDVVGNIRGDYLHLEGNDNTDESEPQLVVDGTAVIKNLKVTGTVEGIISNIDGQDIKPNSVEVSKDLHVIGNATVDGSLNVSGPTKVKDLEVTGELKGVDFNVDGKDIKPRSVVTGDISSSGKIEVSGDANLNGGSGTTFVNNLVITGTTTGLDLGLGDLAYRDGLSADEVGAVSQSNFTLETENLNTVLSLGRKFQNTASNATPARNYPISSAGMLDVIKTSTSGIRQIYYPATGTDVYHRYCENISSTTLTFSDWFKQPTKSELSDYLPVQGGTMRGNIGIDNNSKLMWVKDTDYGIINFHTSGDSASNYMQFCIGDNVPSIDTFRWGSSNQHWADVATAEIKEEWMKLHRGGLVISGGLNLNPTSSDSAVLEIGSQTTSTTPSIDFHSTGGSEDYNARIICSGGVLGQVGSAQVNVVAGKFLVNGVEVVGVSTTQTLTNKTLVSPVLTGKPTAPTPGENSNDDQVATTEFVKNIVSSSIPETPIPLGKGGTGADNAADARSNLGVSYTISTAAAPSDASSYPAGHVWYQVEE